MSSLYHMPFPKSSYFSGSMEENRLKLLCPPCAKNACLCSYKVIEKMALQIAALQIAAPQTVDKVWLNSLPPIPRHYGCQFPTLLTVFHPQRTEPPS